MISRRAPRRSSPQENLRQFSLNNSKGIDVTKAPTDPDTVLSTTNFIPNLDGSLSIRKTLKSEPNSIKVGLNDFVEYLYDNETVVYVKSSGTSADLYILKAADLTQATGITGEDFNIRFYDSTNTLQNYKVNKITLGDTFLKYDALKKSEFIHLSSTTVVSGASFNINAQFNGKLLFNEDLYDSEFKPFRYLKIFKEDSAWVIEIVNPEMNVLTTSEDGSLLFDNNLILDNPYALRDVYTKNAPAVKGILAYATPNAEAKTPPLDVFANTYNYLVYVDVSTNVKVSFGSDTTKQEVSNLGYTEYPISVQYKGTLGAAGAHRNVTLENTVAQLPDFPTGLTMAHVSWTVYVLAGGKTLGRMTAHFDLLHTLDLAFPKTGLLFDDASQIAFKSEFTIHFHSGGGVVANLTESSKQDSYKILTSVRPDAPLKNLTLKVFGSLPSEKYYAAWFKSKDGVVWEQCVSNSSSDFPTINVREPVYYTDSKEPDEYVNRVYSVLQAQSNTDRFLTNKAYSDYNSQYNRVDVYVVPQSELSLAYTYLFKIIKVAEIDSSDSIYDAELSGTQHKIVTEYGRAVYSFPMSNVTEYAEWDSGSPVSGKHLTSSRKLISYGGNSFDNIVYSSEPGSFITSLSYVADVNVGSSTKITSVTPWRSYLIAATESSLSLMAPQEIGWTSKIIAANVGIPEEDGKCCLPGLNGIIFKTGSKVYMAYPNAYAGDDTQVYLTDLSKPISHVLSELSDVSGQFAFATDSEYILMLPDSEKTHCLRYSYDLKNWVYCTYPCIVKSYKMYNIDKITLFAVYGNALYEVLFDADPDSSLKHCDSFQGVEVPIEFELDTGMKTDNISVQKQFVETKCIFATEDDKEIFPMEVIVAIDGDPHITRLDVNSDSPFWKSNKFDTGIVGTSFRLSNVETPGRSSSGILRQLVIRYSGKGRSIRHIFTGTSQSNFRLYETYVRYKTLNVKK